MYIKHLAIENLKSISKFEMDFPEPAGWHVIIGDNGAGKSSVAMGIALGLNGGEDSAFDINWSRFIKKNEDLLKIETLFKLHDIDSAFQPDNVGELQGYKYAYRSGLREHSVLPHQEKHRTSKFPELETNAWGESLNSTDEFNIGWFFAGFGPFRRFSGGEYNKNLEEINPRASAVISLFDEKYTLSEALNWLRELNYRKLEKDLKSESTLNKLINFLNNGNLLPFGTRLNKVSSEGVFFIDGNGNEVEINQLSDGFRSILSLAFELIRLLIRFYDEEKVFKNFGKGDYKIDLPGVVIIDEIDAHLHPTWQTRVGQWFTKYFPALQFIVTTHSPLVCRAAKNGSIWRLSAPGSKIPSGEITGADKDRLIYGNILDAYGTDAFGENLERSEEGFEKLKRYSYLSQKAVYDPQHLSKEDKEELTSLEKIFATDATFTL
jgi:predicted ATP-dependent endonuclease of OLD family